MPWYLTLPYDDYETARASFEWDIPAGYNIAEDLLQKHDDSAKTALYQAYPDGRRETYSFEDLDRLSDQLAGALVDMGIQRGDRVAVVVPQKPENPITHLACWKLGAISVPLSILFGEDALSYRLRDSGARVAVVDETVRQTVESVRGDCPDLEHLVTVDGARQSFEDVLSRGADSVEIAATDRDTRAIIMYTSGSTGPPKGVLHTHGVWLGHCPAFSMYFERDVFECTVWTPADWAWIGALGDALFPAWHYGRPVVGYPRGTFDPEVAFELLDEFDVTHAFLPPTAIRMMMDVDDPEDRYDLELSVICSGGEPLTPEILDWANDTLSGVRVNEIYGQTEANLLVCTSQDWFDAQPGSMGKPVPGHDVAIVDSETGESKPRGEIGEIAVRRGTDPILFEEYWHLPEKTADARVGDWHLTGDLAKRDDEGYFWFHSRVDDLIITAGYRIGPGEVESAILEHPDVEQVGVVGMPDETRGAIITAFVQPIEGVETSEEALREEIRTLVRDTLAKHAYPQQIEFVDELPQTTTGKIKRTTLLEREVAANEPAER